jgi:adenine-specific DNA-methyltransferase
LTSQSGSTTTVFSFLHEGKSFAEPKKGGWKTNFEGMTRLGKSQRLWPTKNGTIQYVRYFDDFSVIPLSNVWTDTGTGSFTDDKIYVVQTGAKVIERCILMASDPGDLVLDPTCGSGTTAYVAEQWGRRWITIDTSRVALALARARIMGARYPFYLLADSKEGQAKEGDVTRTPPKSHATHGNIRQGFVYERVPHITLKSIANNADTGQGHGTACHHGRQIAKSRQRNSNHIVNKRKKQSALDGVDDASGNDNGGGDFARIGLHQGHGTGFHGNIGALRHGDPAMGRC